MGGLSSVADRLKDNVIGSSGGGVEMDSVMSALRSEEEVFKAVEVVALGGNDGA